jgi:hypothetical protein
MMKDEKGEGENMKIKAMKGKGAAASGARPIQGWLWLFVFSSLIPHPSSFVFAGGKNAGTSGAAFLKIDAGARPAAMGGAFTAVADDVHAVAWNPAGLGRVTSFEFTAMRAQWFQELDYGFMAAAYPFSWGTVGLGLATLEANGIDRRLTDTDVPDGSFDARDAAYTLSYGRSLGETLFAGLSAKLIRQTLDGKSAGAFSGDAGVLWRTPHAPLTLGLASRHMGSEVKFEDEGDPLPAAVALGLAYKVFQDRLVLSGDLRRPRDDDFQYAAGTEFAQPLFGDTRGALRAGYSSAAAGISEGPAGVSAGLGLSWRGMGFDVAWAPYGALGQTFRYAFLLRF